MYVFTELHNSLAREHDEENLMRMKESWEKKLPDLNDYLDNILPLLRNASKENRKFFLLNKVKRCGKKYRNSDEVKNRITNTKTNKNKRPQNQTFIKIKLFSILLFLHFKKIYYFYHVFFKPRVGKPLKTAIK